jgi:hypothetical protein
MLDVNTLPKRYRKVEEYYFDECSQLKTRSKRTEEVKKRFQNKCVSSQNKKREERALP